MKKRLNRLLKKILKYIFYVFLITIAWVLVYRFINPPLTPLMVIQYLQGSDINKQWKDYEEISDNMKLAVIAAEDQRFLQHSGFDVKAIQKALEEKRDGKRERLRGASTISQQVAKNVFLYPSRSWFRKGMEAYFTFLIEGIWDKRRTIEIYLNVIEMGDGVFGVGKAADIYFGKSAENLSQGEAALIAAILPNPRIMNPSQPSPYVYSRQQWIIRQMNHLGGIKILNGL